MDTMTYNIATMFLVFWAAFIIMGIFFLISYALGKLFDILISSIKEAIEGLKNVKD